MNHPEWMKAAVYYGPGDIRIEQVCTPLPPGPEEVCLQIQTVSLCGTDASQYLVPSMIPLNDVHPDSGHQGPLVLGHEVCGVVVARGTQVQHLAIGDRVAVGAGMWCGQCPRCLEGRPNICEHAFVYGLHAPGGLAERALFPAKMCVRVPAGCPSEAAVLAQPLAVALHALKRGQVAAGMRVAIFGVGGIGSLMVAALSLQNHVRPARLIALDIDPARLAQASELGADVMINPLLSNPLQEIDLATKGQGVDLAIEVTGQEIAVAQAVWATRSGGRILQVGIPREPVDLPLQHLVLHEKELLGTNGHICPVDLPAALNLLATTDLADRVGTRTIALDDVVVEGLLPFIEHRTSEKVIVTIGKPSLTSQECLNQTNRMISHTKKRTIV